MKKIGTLLFGLLLSVASFAQTANSVYSMTSTFGYTTDTVTNTATKWVKTQVQSGYNTVSIQAVVTKISGTVAGNVILQGSNDGTNYVSIGLDTLATTDVTTNTHVFTVQDSPYEYYRLSYTGSGTMAAKLKGYLMPNGNTGRSSVFNLKSTYGYTSDTVTNGATNSILLRVQGNYKTVSIQAVVTKLSGTAAGTVTLQGSNDGTNYETVATRYLRSVAPYSTSFGTATHTVTNVTTNTKIFVLNKSPYAYYKLSYTGSGTMSCTLKGYMLPNP